MYVAIVVYCREKRGERGRGSWKGEGGIGGWGEEHRGREGEGEGEGERDLYQATPTKTSW